MIGNFVLPIAPRSTDYDEIADGPQNKVNNGGIR
jgi:hypothetical protein